MPRHVIHVAAVGLPTPRRLKRQRALLAALAELYRPLDQEDGGGSLRGIRPGFNFGVAKRTPPEDAVSKFAGLLDGIDARWRSYVRVFDRSRGGVDHEVRG
jgi:hypothetical protein